MYDAADNRCGIPRRRARWPGRRARADAAGKGAATRSLEARAWLAVGALAAAMGALVFVPAGTLRYPEAWVYLAVFFALTAVTTGDLLRRDPALLARRLRGGPTAERRPVQKLVMSITSLGFAALLVVPALDHRHGWSHVPLAAVLAGDALVVAGFACVARVYRENPYSFATVDVAPDQRVISTGPYAVVRHPMYATAWLYLAGTPLALGSWWGLVPLALILPFLVWRLVDEERLLAASLPGYVEYQRRVRYRLLPGVW